MLFAQKYRKFHSRQSNFFISEQYELTSTLHLWLVISEFNKTYLYYIYFCSLPIMKCLLDQLICISYGLRTSVFVHRLWHIEHNFYFRINFTYKRQIDIFWHFIPRYNISQYFLLLWVREDNLPELKLRLSRVVSLNCIQHLLSEFFF